MKVRFNWSRVLLDFDKPVVFNNEPVKDTVGYATVGIGAGTICYVKTESCACSGSGVTTEYIMILDTNFGIDKLTFDHWVERGRVKIF